jgi:hypothetical protein
VRLVKARTLAFREEERIFGNEEKFQDATAAEAGTIFRDESH